MNEDSPSTIKVITIYKRLSDALDWIENHTPEEHDHNECLALLVQRLRQLSKELESLLWDDETATLCDDQDFDRGSKIRVIEREAAALVAAIRSYVAIGARDRAERTV